MAATGFSYQRLRNEGGTNDEEITRAIDRVKARIRWSSRLKRVHIRKRLRMKIPSLIRNFTRRRARMATVSLTKLMKRLKESQSHFGDLFAGNYLFMQVTPTPLKSSSPYAVAHAPDSLHESVKRIEDGPSPRVSEFD